MKGARVGRVLAAHQGQVEALSITDKERLAKPLRLSVKAEVRLIETPRAADVLHQQRQVFQRGARHPSRVYLEGESRSFRLPNLKTSPLTAVALDEGVGPGGAPATGGVELDV